MHIFYAHSISGKHTAEEWTPKEIIDTLYTWGHTVSSEEFYIALDPHMSPAEIYHSDIAMIQDSDLLLVNVTNPSLGVGYEIGFAEALGKPIICFYQAESTHSISPMILGNSRFKTYGLVHMEELEQILEKIAR